MEESGQPHALTFYTRENNPDTQWIEGSAGGLDVAEKINISCACRESNHDSLVVHIIV
jgi:hypothetical protein